MSAQEVTIRVRGELDQTQSERLMALLEKSSFWPPQQCDHGRWLGLGYCRDCDEERCPAPVPTRSLLTLATCWQADGDCDCGAPMTTDGRSVWCVRGRDCPALPAHVQCDHGQPLGAACSDCDEERDASPSLLTLARHYAAEYPTSDAGRLARAYLAQLDEAGVP